MIPYLAGQVDYAGRAGHLDHLVDHLRKCTRLRWEANELRDVCCFLAAVHEDSGRAEVSRLLETFAKSGMKRYPDVPFFPLLAAKLEMQKGPRRCKQPLARQYFQRVVELAKNSGCAEDLRLAEEAQRSLAILQQEMSESSLFGLPPWFSDHDEDDDGWEDADGPPSPLAGFFKKLEEICESMGVDPEEVLRKAESNSLPGANRFFQEAFEEKMSGKKKPWGKR